MMIKYLFILILLPNLLSANNYYWSFSNHNESWQNDKLIITLDEPYFLNLINDSPLTTLNITSSINLEFPLPNKDMIQFNMYESPVIPDGLSEKYPEIKTYTGRGVSNPNNRVSVTTSSRGIKILILNNNNRIFIQKLNSLDNIYNVSYIENKNDSLNRINNCSTNGCVDIMTRDEYEDIETENRDFPYCVGEPEPCFPIGNNLVTFRYAGILTSEANNEVAGGTVEGGLAWIVAMVNQINLVWIRELSFRLELIENSDQIIYTDENPTPELFTSYDMYTELPLVHQHLTQVIGPGGYGPDQENLLWEYGAVFNTGYGGGLAYVPGSTSANLPSYAIHIHEIGHNLGSSHNCTSENGWRCSFGGTAMCNRGNTLPSNFGDQYSSHTIDIAIRYQQLMYSGNNYDYQTGWLQETTINNIPEVFVQESGFTIPKETPFLLEGNAEDINENDQLTYSWEQNDASNIAFSPPDYPPNTGPLFCSVDATSKGNIRYFPHIESLLENNYFTENIEQLPFASREMNMRLLVRDNNLISGGFNYKNVQFFVNENAGPFRVTSQLEEEIWEVGSEYNITWDVANTDNPSFVNCLLVDILLSVDGYDFNIVLAENTPNDGNHEIIVPSIPSNNTSRLMVKSVDNIFFDINNSYITIINSHLPEININTSEINLSLQIGSIYNIDREIENSGEIGSILVYNPITEIDIEGDGYLSFDGIDDYVDLGANILSGNGDFSISLWIKSTSTNKVIMQQRNGGFNGEYQLKFDENGKINFWSYRDGYKWSVTSMGSYNDNYWHHLVIVQDNTINGGRLYIDGIENVTNSDGVLYIDGAIHTYLGADMRDFVNYLNGEINDINIFNSAVSSTEVNILFNNGFGFNPTYNHDGFTSSDFLIASYPMQAMIGDTLFDLTQNGFDGIINGPQWNGDLEPSPYWIDIQSESSWLEAGESESIILNIDTSELLADTDHNGKLIIISNSDPLPIEIPISLSILEDGQLGDINIDGNIDILDVIIVVNLILFGEFNGLADLNIDGIINVLDIIQIVNIILNN